jgi:hypothetical protein
MRDSLHHLYDRNAVLNLMAFVSARFIVLAHIEIEDKLNVFPAAQQIIRDLGFTGIASTAGAMPCQKAFLNRQRYGELHNCPSQSQPAALAQRNRRDLRLGKAHQLRRDSRPNPPRPMRASLIETVDAARRLGRDWDGRINTAAPVITFT